MTGLRELAEAATPGEWEVDTNAPFSRDLTGIFVPAKKRYAVLFSDREQPKRADADYIAAASPSVVLGLLDERDRLEAAIREVLNLVASPGPRATEILSAALEHQPNEQEPK